MSGYDPECYEAWYRTPRGRWIAERESALLLEAVRPRPGESLLDAGCGSGHFSRRLAAAGLEVTGLDIDAPSLDYARRLDEGVRYLPGDLRQLPFADAAFDHVTAVTSLSFVDRPERATAELWRVARRSLTLGLLNRRSLLHRGKGEGYRGARWDRVKEVTEQWLAPLRPTPVEAWARSALFLPRGGGLERVVERLLPERLPWGGFLLIHLRKA